MLTRAFVSFDYDHDLALKGVLLAQSILSDSPFAIADYSIKEPSSTWKSEARGRIRQCDVVIVLCGRHTHTATGVAEELKMAQEEGIPYFLLAGYSTGDVTKPSTALLSDKLYKWTWDNLKNLVGGSR